MSTRTKHLGSVHSGHPYGSRGRTAPGSQVAVAARAAAAPAANASRRQLPRYRARRRLVTWDRVLLVSAVLVVGFLIVNAILEQVTTPKGNVTATRTSYDFGDVPIGGGDITTKFPLTVEGDARAIDITST